MVTDPHHHQKDLDMGSRNRINTISRTLGIEIEIGCMRMIDMGERWVFPPMCQGGSISAMAMTVVLQERNTFNQNYHLDLTIHHTGVMLNLHLQPMLGTLLTLNLRNGNTPSQTTK
jgi:hypothetical protein